MQPKTNMKLDEASFLRLRKTALNMAKSNRMVKSNPTSCFPIPQEVGIQLTNKCDLRCRHCFEWSPNGYNHHLESQKQKDELSINIIQDVLEETKQTKANLFLWGGEPLVYSRWAELCDLLKQYERWTVICTNGIQVLQKLESLMPISNNVALLTSVEGFEEDNDYIRGKGSFKKMMDGVKEVLRLSKEGVFRGKQSLHCTINNNNVHSLYEFAKYCESLGVDTLYICFPWFIPEKVADHMDDFCFQNFSWEKLPNRTWRSFDFRLAPENLSILKKQMQFINSHEWKIRIRYQPAVEPAEVDDFVLGTECTAQCKHKCLALMNRVDILSDGSISACKLFREFIVGNLHDDTLFAIWNSERMATFRKTLSQGLMPVCSKCILLYLNGV